jgi:hypothetical protein
VIRTQTRDLMFRVATTKWTKVLKEDGRSVITRSIIIEILSRVVMVIGEAWIDSRIPDRSGRRSGLRS